jgi:serine/threonine protein kinase
MPILDATWAKGDAGTVVETVPAGTKLGRYEVLKQLAQGGMADLLLARTSGLEGFERHVVIKQIRAEQAKNAKFVEMFVTEARLAGALHHHNIVQVQDIGEENGRHYFAMEYVHGEDLRKLLHTLYDQKQKLPLEHVISIVATVAAALHHAHEAKAPDGKPLNIVHRDVTPANILVSYDGNIKVVDFGIAKAAASAVETDRGVIKAKVPYMTPEQCTGQKVDRRSDIFSLGIVAFELVTTRRLFKGDTDFMTMSEIVSGEVPRPSKYRLDIPSKLEGIILKALSRSPVDRYQTADEMRGALETYAARSGLRMSANSLAAYMKKLFGERPEPWLERGQRPAGEIAVDFDGTATGIVPPPAEVVETFAIPTSMHATKSSPIRQAYSRALGGTPTNAVPPEQLAQLTSMSKREAPMKPAVPPPTPETAKPPPTPEAAKPPPTPEAAKPPPTPEAALKPEPEDPTTKRALPESKRALTPDVQTAFGGETTDVDVRTDVATPPPLPKVMVKEADKESTEIVAPLAIATETRVYPRKRRGWVMGVTLLAIVGGAAGVYLFLREDEHPHRAEPTVETTPAVEKPAPEPETPKAPSDDIPWEQRTANNTPTADTPAQPPAKADPAPTPPAAAAAEPPKAKPEPPKVEPPKPEAPKVEPPKPEPPKAEPPKTAAAAPPPPKIETKPTPPTPPDAPAKVAAKPATKPATKPSKPATKTKPATPQWDPDALFLKKK